MDLPETRYASTADGPSIAYQVFGQGVVDLLYVPGYHSNLELNWELPAYARMLRRLASFSRLITVDRRGTDLSRTNPRAHLVRHFRDREVVSRLPVAVEARPMGDVP